MSVASCADSSSELRPPSSQPLAAGYFPRRIPVNSDSVKTGRTVLCEDRQVRLELRGKDHGLGISRTAIVARKPPQSARFDRGSKESRSSQAMPNVLNPEPESITLNTELETPTLEPATESEQPSFESTSNPETAEAAQSTRAGRRCPNRACTLERRIATEEAAPARPLRLKRPPKWQPSPPTRAHESSRRVDGRFFRRPRSL